MLYRYFFHFFTPVDDYMDVWLHERNHGLHPELHIKGEWQTKSTISVEHVFLFFKWCGNLLRVFVRTLVVHLVEYSIISYLINCSATFTDFFMTVITYCAYEYANCLWCHFLYSFSHFLYSFPYILMHMSDFPYLLLLQVVFFSYVLIYICWLQTDSFSSKNICVFWSFFTSSTSLLHHHRFFYVFKSLILRRMCPPSWADRLRTYRTSQCFFLSLKKRSEKTRTYCNVPHFTVLTENDIFLIYSGNELCHW